MYFLKAYIYLKGLSQNYQKADGPGHNQKEIGEYILLERKRMYSGFQYHVYQLLYLQQTRRGRCSHGTNSREIVSNKGTVFITLTFLYILYQMTSQRLQKLKHGDVIF